MTRHEDIEKLIDALNEGHMRDRVFQSTLSDEVDFALVWNRAKLYLKMVKQRLETALGSCDELCLNELIYDDVGNLDGRIHAFIMRRQHSKKLDASSSIPSKSLVPKGLALAHPSLSFAPQKPCA
jgi:hypothetical protein